MRRQDGHSPDLQPANWSAAFILIHSCSQGYSSPIYLGLHPPHHDLSLFPRGCLGHCNNKFCSVLQFLRCPMRSLLFSVRPVLETLDDIFLPLTKFLVEFLQGQTQIVHIHPIHHCPRSSDLCYSLICSFLFCVFVYVIYYHFCSFFFFKCWIANYQIFLQFPVCFQL